MKDEDRDPLPESVGRFADRRRRFGREQGRALALAISMVGLGWIVVVPALAGLLLGRWLDVRLGTGLAIRAGLGLLGLVLGSTAAWRRVGRREWS